MKYTVEYGQCPQIARHDYCARCEHPTENSEIASGCIPSGPNGETKEVGLLILCLDCRWLLGNDASQFWARGWPCQ